MKSKWYILFLLFFIILCLEFLPIVADRIKMAFYPTRDNGMIVRSGTSLVPFENRPYTKGTNYAGYREPEPKESIIFIGDSVTFGVRVEPSKTFPWLVGGALRIPWHNWAVPGYDCLDVLASLDVNRWKNYKPLRVVYGYCINDFSTFSREYIEGVGLISKTQRLSDYVRKLIKGKTEGILNERLAKWADKVPLSIVILPYQGSLDGWRLRSLRMIKNFCSKNNVPYLEINNLDQTYFLTPSDMYHLNEKGHIKVANYIIEWLKINNIIPQKES